MPHKFCINFAERLCNSHLYLENKNDRSNRTWILNWQNTGLNSYISCPVIFQNWVTIWSRINIALAWKGHRFMSAFGFCVEFVWTMSWMILDHLSDPHPLSLSLSLLSFVFVRWLITPLSQRLTRLRGESRWGTWVSDITHPELTGCGSCRVLDHSLQLTTSIKMISLVIRRNLIVSYVKPAPSSCKSILRNLMDEGLKAPVLFIFLW